MGLHDFSFPLLHSHSEAVILMLSFTIRTCGLIYVGRNFL